MNNLYADKLLAERRKNLPTEPVVAAKVLSPAV
jgi:hypothetical protein